MNSTKIKICGLFRLCDAEFVNEAMPDFAGFVFYKNSARFVTEEMAETLRSDINPDIRTVGVFVDASMDQVERLYCKKTISIIQLHGSEKNAYIEELRKRLPGAVIWKAVKVRSSLDFDEASESVADMVLLDNGLGTGEAFDWSLIKSLPRKFILAGGLTAENIPIAIESFHPYAVDVSSGVETDGVKDKKKILAVISAVKRS